jgi:hypothetical protein
VEDVMSDKNDKKLSEQLKTIKEPAEEIIKLVGSLVGCYLVYKASPGPFVYITAAVCGILLWLMFLNTWRAKRTIPGFPKDRIEPLHGKWIRYTTLAGLVGLPLVASGLILAIVLDLQKQKEPLQLTLRVFRPPVLFQCPPLTVTIAGFKPPSEFERDRAPAQEIRHNFLIELMRRIDRQDIKTKDRDGAVINTGVSEWEESAMKFGQSEEGKAHLVVYGALQTADPIEVTVYVRRTNLCENPGGATAGAGAVQSIEPGTWEFTRKGEVKEVSQQMANIAVFVAGLALYEKHDLTRASEVLGNSKTPEARFYQGLIYGERARQIDPIQNLNHALEKFQEVFSNDWDDPPSLEIQAHANVNIGNAFLLLSQVDFQQANFQQAENHVSEANGSYMKALPYYEQTLEAESGSRQDKKRIRGAWAATKSNLAIAMIWQAKMQEPQQRQNLFNQAEVDLQQALQQYKRSEYPSEWLVATSTLASLWVEQSATSQDPKEKLKRAKEAFEAALSTIDQNGTPRNQVENQYKQAQIQANLAAVYSNEALESMMQPDAAVDLYRKASVIFTERNYRLAWAKNESDMGIALTKQARLEQNKEQAIALLREAIDERFNHALQVYLPDRYPRNWALTTAYLADAKREMSKRKEDHQLLLNAVQLSRDAVAKLKSAPTSRFGLDLARVQQILGDLCYEASLLGGSNQTSFLDEAYKAYDAARNIWSQYSYTYDQQKAKDRLSDLQTARQSVNAQNGH